MVGTLAFLRSHRGLVGRVVYPHCNPTFEQEAYQFILPRQHIDRNYAFQQLVGLTDIQQKLAELVLEWGRITGEFRHTISSAQVSVPYEDYTEECTFINFSSFETDGEYENRLILLKKGVELALLDQQNPTPPLTPGIQALLDEHWTLAAMHGQGAVVDSDRSQAIRVQLRQAIQAYARDLNAITSKDNS